MIDFVSPTNSGTQKLTATRLQNRLQNRLTTPKIFSTPRFSSLIPCRKTVFVFSQRVRVENEGFDLSLLGNSFYFCFRCAPDHLVCSLDWFSETAVLSLTVLAQE